MYVVPEITPFVKGFFKNATSVCPKQLVQAMLLRKHLTMPTDIDKIFKNKLNKSSHNTFNRNKRNFIKKCKFWDSSHPQGKCPAYGKVCHVCNKKNHFKVCCLHVGKKYMKLKRINLRNPLTRVIMNFLLKLLMFRILYILTKSRIKTLIGQ